MKNKKHSNVYSGLDKNLQTKNRHELYEADYIDKLSKKEKLLA